MKVYLLLKMLIFQMAMLVFRGGIPLYSYSLVFLPITLVVEPLKLEKEAPVNGWGITAALDRFSP